MIIEKQEIENILTAKNKLTSLANEEVEKNLNKLVQDIQINPELNLLRKAKIDI